MRRKLISPLAQRHGLDPVRMKMPAEGPWATVRDYLGHKLPMVDPERLNDMFAEGGIVNAHGSISAHTVFEPDMFIWFHRDLPVETPVPFEIDIIHRDDNILVVDKPHFLATIPRGKHIVETALVRLRKQLNLPQLSPAHRLDRVTAGLVMFVINPGYRGAYQNLFRDRLVHKEYEAIAPFNPQLTLPATVRSRIIKERGIITAQEIPGEPNSETFIELIERKRNLGRYRVTPVTGRTHQIRLHMSRLNIPILGDDFYPTLTETPLDDFSRPLQLLAKSLRFTDPITSVTHSFTSGRALVAWNAFSDWDREFLSKPI